MNLKFSFTIRWKLILFALIPFLFFLLYHIFYMVPLLEEDMYQAKETQITDMVLTGIGIIEHFYRQEEDLSLSREDAQTKALDVLRSMRYGPKNLDYFWINDFQPTMILHPFRPDLEGEDLSKITDPNGIFLFLEFVKVSEKEGFGFVEYQWQYYDGIDRIEPKLSFVQTFEPWQWILGTGVYTNDIQQMVHERIQDLLLGSLTIGGFLVLVFFIISRSIIQPVNAITSHANSIAAGDLNQSVSSSLLTRKDELGLLALAFDTMKKNLEKTFLQLKESEENLSITLHSIGDAVLTTDSQGKITHMNSRAEELTGWAIGEVEGEPVHRIIKLSHGKNSQSVLHPVEKVLTTGKRLFREEERLLLARNGKKFHVRDSASPIRDRFGEMVGVVLVFSDVTEKYETHRSLQDLEERYRHLFKHLPVGLMLEDQEGTIVDINNTFSSITGYSREELVGERLEEFLLPENRPLVEKNIKRILNGEDLELEVEFERKDGKRIILQLKETRVLLPNNKIGVLSVQTNITQRKMIESELLRQKKWLESLFKDSTEAIVMIDKNHCVLDINNRFEDLFKYRLEEIKGMGVDEVMNMGKEGSADIELTNLVLSGAKVEAEGTRYDKEGSPIEVLIKGISIFIDGQLMGGYALYSDISARKEAEERIRYLSFHDSLTGLYNRSYLEEEIKRLNTHRQLPISVIMADVNGFKLINDTYGHSLGDQLLISAGRILKDSCRQEDIVTRWGGDEFVILLPKTSRKEALMICNRMVEECKQVEVGEIPVQIAFGTATKENIEEDIFTIFKEAEDFMYKHKLVESKSARGKIISTLLHTLGEKSDETEEHAWRMQRMAIDIGEDLGLPPSELDRLSLLLTLHDIGKITIAEDILTKPGKLSEEEWEIIKTHPEVGARIASSTEDFSHVAKDILSHHERWDGKGYPGGLKKEEIPLLARITAVVDSFDVMTNKRAYKEPMGIKDAIKELQRCAGTQFDPKIVRVFIELLEKSYLSYEKEE